jgi:hypothetical protein
VKDNDLLMYAGLGIGAFLLYRMVTQQQAAAASAPTATEAAQSAAATLQANLNAAAGISP